MPQLTDLINMILALDNSDNQKRQLALQQQEFGLRKQLQDSNLQQVPLAQVASFQNLVKDETDPTTLGNLVNLYASKTGLPKDVFASMAANTTPSIASQNADILKLYTSHLKDPNASTPGVDWSSFGNFAANAASAMTSGMGQGTAAIQGATAGAIQTDPRLATAAATQQATGQNVGDYAMSRQLSNLSPADQVAMLRVAHGTELSAGQKQEGTLQRGSQALTAQGLGLQGQGLALQALTAAETANLERQRIAQTGAIAVMSDQTGIEKSKIAAAAKAQRDVEADNARKRLQSNIDFISKNAMTSAGRSIRLDQIIEDYDMLHGQGAFVKRYGASPTLDPGTLARIIAP